MSESDFKQSLLEATQCLPPNAYMRTHMGTHSPVQALYRCEVHGASKHELSPREVLHSCSGVSTAPPPSPGIGQSLEQLAYGPFSESHSLTFQTGKQRLRKRGSCFRFSQAVVEDLGSETVPQLPSQVVFPSLHAAACRNASGMFRRFFLKSK